ncbi:50S ribosomal protein L31e [Candidatus Nitrosotenuis uzonensis]|uniref:Large ribosomal subunit protein eL31 n=1 Tax=Candidatus Nitrosotenuis uzonensis TaxID=1407055 RepID=A0A812F1Z5_9ARCH|nr:50S ribosomal protein L31e [Candidatus Nitrosotenuis uzonensis]MCA2003874.1 60S ribosomal protein L31 [Candidatus Nitrosotenuis sp.]CAE6496390.1 50S ribosomal protein L31e [Candidatus Nitrosotenuis uzonensis]
MSQEAERVYTINLGKVWLSPNNQRAKRAINMIKEFSRRHMKTEQIKIDQELSQVVWQRGIRSPPRKIRVKMAKTDDGYVLVSPYEEDVKPKTEEKTRKEKSTDAKEQKEEQVETKEKVDESKPKEEKDAKPKEDKKEKPKKESKSEKPEKKSTAKKPAKKSK